MDLTKNTEVEEIIEDNAEAGNENKKAKKIKEPKEPKAPKKSKLTKAEITAEPEEVAEEPKPDMILYLIIDKPVHGILKYFRESGLKVSNMFDNIKDAKDAVLMQSEPTRIVVVDTGTGKFTTTTMREELIDMLGISDEQNRTTVFYTDSVLKIDTNRALGRSGKNIDWAVYKSTSIVAAVLLSYNENYIYDMEDSDEIQSADESILDFKGLTLGTPEVPRHNIPGLSPEAIMTHLVMNEDGALPKYEIKLK